MIKDYLDEILDGKKTFDARSYPTNKRGTIALIDSKSMKVLGYIELVGIREISAQEYALWHCTGRWSDCVMQVDITKKYYAWDFCNPKREKNPYRINAEKHTWISVPNI